MGDRGHINLDWAQIIIKGVSECHEYTIKNSSQDFMFNSENGKITIFGRSQNGGF